MSRLSDPRPLRVLVVDDEPVGVGRIVRLLGREPDLEIVGTAEHGEEAIDAIRALHPDLVFLDIHMPGKSGLDVVREVGPTEMPVTVFVTAYDQYALSAFDLAAVDYLVKPYDDERFEQALARARRTVELADRDVVLSKLIAILEGRGGASGAAPLTTATRDSAASPPYLERIVVPARGRLAVIPIGEVDYICASGPYAEIHAGPRKHLIRESMQKLDEQLDPRTFLRIHRSTIVRIELIVSLLRGDTGDYEAILKDGTRLRVGRSRRDVVQQRLGR